MQSFKQSKVLYSMQEYQGCYNIAMPGVKSNNGPNYRLSMILLQSCLGAFKSMNALSKTVESCIITLDTIKEEIIFKLKCFYGMFSMEPLCEIVFLSCHMHSETMPYLSRYQQDLSSQHGGL